MIDASGSAAPEVTATADGAGAASQSVSESTVVVSIFASTSRENRRAGVGIVLAVAVLPFIVRSTAQVFGIATIRSGSSLQYGYLSTLLIELTSLALLLYVLHQNGQSLSGLGLAFRMSDIGHGILLIIVHWFISQITIIGITRFYELALGHAPPRFTWPAAGTSVIALPLLFAVVNPFFEELIVRGFLISETIALTGNAVFAVTLSVLLQTAYHLYQGIVNTCVVALVFFVFSLYYLKTRRLWPVIFAHLWADLSFSIYWLNVRHY